MTPRKHNSRKHRKMVKRAMRASVIAAILIGFGIYWEFHILLKLAELVGAAIAEAILFPE